MGLLGWTTDQFWGSTPHDFWRSFKGWRRANGKDKPKAHFLREDQLQEVFEMLEQHKQIDASIRRKKDRG